MDNNLAEMMKSCTLIMPTNNLPNHLIIDHILPRFPVKSLLRFKSVSKSWLSIISSLKFAKIHLKYSSLRPQFLILPHFRTYPTFSFLHYDECDCNLKGLVQLKFNNFYDCSVISSMEIVGSSNGLVCFLVMDLINRRYLLLWNPATRQIRNISFRDGFKFYGSHYSSNFSYVKSIDDYKIFFLLESLGSFSALDVYVFTLSTRCWKKIANLGDYDRFVVSSNPGVLVDETIYLSWYSNLPNADRRVEIDLVTGEIKRIPWTMNWLSRYRYTSFASIKGRLALLCRASDVVDVWMLKQPNVWTCWEKVTSLSTSKVRFLVVSETGKCLIVHMNQLKVVDLCHGSPQLPEEGIRFDVWEGIAKSYGYVESLISPFMKTKDDAVEIES